MARCIRFRWKQASRQRLADSAVTRKLILLCHGGTQSMRTGGFPSRDEPTDPQGLKKLGTVRPLLRNVDRCFTSPARAALETAAALELQYTVDHGLRDMEFDDWSGRSFEEVAGDDPAGFAHWLANPETGAPRGETMADVTARLERWHAEIDMAQTLLAITHPMVVRAAFGLLLKIPAAAAMRIDLAPLSSAIFSYNGVWRLQSVG